MPITRPYKITFTSALQILRGAVALDPKSYKEANFVLVTRHNIPYRNYESLHYLPRISKFMISSVYHNILEDTVNLLLIIFTDGSKFL